MAISGQCQKGEWLRTQTNFSLVAFHLIGPSVFLRLPNLDPAESCDHCPICVASAGREFNSERISPVMPTNKPTAATPLAQLTTTNLTGSKLDIANIAELFASCGQKVKPSNLQEVLFTPGSFAVGVYRGQILAGVAIYSLSGRQVRLINIVVKVDYRRQGIGRKLLDKIAAQTIRHGRLDLMVSLPSPSGSVARFFIACKFRPAGNCATELTGLRFFFRRSIADDVLESVMSGEGRVVK